MSTEATVRRYLFLHSAVLFLLTSLQGFLISFAEIKHRETVKHINTHLVGVTAALWLSAIAASLDSSSLSLVKKRVLAGAAIIFGWASLASSFMIAFYGITLQYGKITGEIKHDTVAVLRLVIAEPTAVVAIFLWITGFFPLHPASSGPATRKKRS